MSWAEIKKAVNSRMADMPLDDMFGLQFVRLLNNTGESVVTGINGILFIPAVAQPNHNYPTSVYDMNAGLEIGGTSAFQYNENMIIPIVATRSYAVRNCYSASTIGHRAYIFAWGGGIS